MIRGAVNSRHEAVIRVSVPGPSGSEQQVDAVVDSGFSGSLTLPDTTIAALGLVRQSGGTALLADGSRRQFDIYAAEIGWDGGWRTVLVSSLGDEALLGMRLLAGHEVRIAVVPGGDVEVTPLP